MKVIKQVVRTKDNSETVGYYRIHNNGQTEKIDAWQARVMKNQGYEYIVRIISNN